MKNIIVALDGLNKDTALNISEEIKDYIWGVKFNDLLDRYGVDIITEFRKRGVNVFADPKLKDIPNTVKNRIRHYKDAGANFITVFADGGINMMEEAKDVAGDCKVFAVTVLTSLSQEQCLHLYYDTAIGSVTRLAVDAIKAGVDGIVCSPNELSVLKHWVSNTNKVGDVLSVITPGIRPEWYTTKDDQKRVTTPSIAITGGADYLVIGRPITKSSDIKHAAELTYKEINKLTENTNGVE